jgi:hypothetical protein
MEKSAYKAAGGARTFLVFPPNQPLLTVHIKLTEESVWTLQKESRMVRAADVVVAVLLMAITLFNIARFVGAVEKRILSRLRPTKKDNYEPLMVNQPDLHEA